METFSSCSMDVEPTWMGFENGTVEGQLLFKERGISRAWRSGSRKAARPEDTGRVSKLCIF